VGTEEDKNTLIELASKIDQQMSELGFGREKRRFSAHLTMGRVRDNRGIEPTIKKIQQKETFDVGKFVVKEVLFIKSELTQQGPIYTVLKKIKLN
ncbi:hypothetical protein ISS22_14930, partial [candidate division KSB1 bacterium]|nr:hypothetical protein [candidate division KSB1 bacterium]